MERDLPDRLRWPPQTCVYKIGGEIVGCETTLDLPALDAFVHKGELLIARVRAAIESGDPDHIARTRERAATVYGGLLAKVLTDEDSGLQLEPLYSVAHMYAPVHISEMGLHDDATRTTAFSLATVARYAHMALDDAIAFHVHEDPVFEKAVLRAGTLLIPRPQGTIAYRYRHHDGLSSENGEPGISFTLEQQRWKTIEEAVAGVRTTEAASVVSAAAGIGHDVRRTILPLFALRYPHLERQEE